MRTPVSSKGQMHVYNMKIMNQSLKERRFKMTGTAVWKNIITKDMYMASIDIKDAYLHIPVGKESRRFMRYEWEGNIFELKALPFGLAQAPYVFTRMLQPLVMGAREHHLRTRHTLPALHARNNNKT